MNKNKPDAKQEWFEGGWRQSAKLILFREIDLYEQISYLLSTTYLKKQNSS